MTRSENKKQRPKYELPIPYENLADSYWTRVIKFARRRINIELPCYLQCIKNLECKKLSLFERTLGELEAILELMLDMDSMDGWVKDVRITLLSLLIDVDSQIKGIKRCIYIQKRLTKGKGYPIWYDL